MATVVKIKTDRANYARHESGRNVVTATLQLSNVADNDTVEASLVRLDGYGSVLTVTSAPLSAGASSVKLSFSLEACTDPQYTHIYRARSGDYAVQAGGVSSPTFTVSLVSIDRLRNEVCKGLPLLTGETVGPLQQPVNCTGVSIVQCKPDMFQRIYSLSYNHTAQTLSWDGGSAVNVSQGGTFYLTDSTENWWVQINVDELALPLADASDSIIISEQQMTDNQIYAEIKHAQAQLEDFFMTYLEPTQVCTQFLSDYIKQPNNGLASQTNDFQDVFNSAVNYLRPEHMNQWVWFQAPVRGLIQVEELHGFLNETDVVQLDKAWWSWDEKTGLIQLVPSMGAAISWAYYTGFFYAFLVGPYDYVPNFWHGKYTCGYRDLRNNRANVLQALEYIAAINILRQAALHAKPGYTSEGITRDGLQANIAYQKQIYGDTIDQYQRWLDENLKGIRRRAYGINVRLI